MEMMNKVLYPITCNENGDRTMIPGDLLENYLIDQECVSGTVPALSASMAISSDRRCGAIQADEGRKGT